MMLKWFGAAVIIVGCGGFGLSMAASVKRECRQLIQLVHILDFFESELQYHLTSLPELCRLAAHESSGSIRNLFETLSVTLSSQTHPDARSCMYDTLKNQEIFTGRVYKHLQQLGKSLGRFDLNGQIQGIRTIRKVCESDIEILRRNKDIRTRSYQTLSLCAGAALVILFV